MTYDAMEMDMVVGIMIQIRPLEIGQRATKAGMVAQINFHYSILADQLNNKPKAWKGLSIEEKGREGLFLYKRVSSKSLMLCNAGMVQEGMKQ